MAKQSSASHLTNLFNVAGFILDGYNGIRHDAKNKQLVYLSLGLSAVGTAIDFYVSIKSPSKLRKLSDLGSFAINGLRLFTSFRKVKNEYDYH
ncbi:hypothetical protein [Staphylococcus saccharolyticus]|uniref:hypothetical protein n=1 Tax=Staphylococcus saccharolyticus TaxID=33028 RepID=UPI00102D9B83|nr:hypothetical protein [Staphylococcus saccharolyticus]QRJ66615.1 hypothetical protein DMB76_010880 [Staphylococcus saccharolyticus]